MKSNLLHAHVTAQFNGVAPERIYSVYVDADEHARATGHPAVIDAREGGAFSAYDGYLTGAFIRLIPGRLVVQFWHSRHFKDSDPDAILSIAFCTIEYENAEASIWEPL
jgi:hypothetical protein